MKRLACTIVALALGAACGPTKPGEAPPLAPRPDPGLPTEPSSVPGIPDPDKPPTGPSPEPANPGDGSQPSPQPISYEFRAAGARIDPLARPGESATPDPNQQRPPDAGVPGDGPVLPPLPDGGLPPDARRTDRDLAESPAGAGS
jgi:hypothetical protein